MRLSWQLDNGDTGVGRTTVAPVDVDTRAERMKQEEKA